MAQQQLDNGFATRATRSRCSDRFLAGLKPFKLVTFISHINPDPDSMGAMLGLAHLVETVLGKKTRLTRDGIIGRAENQTMVDLLGIDMIPIEEVQWEQGEA